MSSFYCKLHPGSWIGRRGCKICRYEAQYPRPHIPEPQPPARSEDALVLPEIYKSCAHPQSVWFDVHWRPIFEQLKRELDDANFCYEASMRAAESFRQQWLTTEKERDQLKARVDEQENILKDAARTMMQMRDHERAGMAKLEKARELLRLFAEPRTFSTRERVTRAEDVLKEIT